MDPYCKVKIGNNEVSGDVCYKGGKNPYWEEPITIVVGNESKCVVEVKDKALFLPDANIGSFEVDLKEIESKGKINKWFTIMHNNESAGEILLEAYTVPDMELPSYQDLEEDLKNRERFDFSKREELPNPSGEGLKEKNPEIKKDVLSPSGTQKEEVDLTKNQENFEFPKLEELPYPCGKGLREKNPKIKKDILYSSGTNKEEADLTKNEDKRVDQVNKEQTSGSVHQSTDRWEGEGGFVMNQEKINFPKLEELPSTCDVDMERAHILKKGDNQENKECSSNPIDKDVPSEPIAKNTQPEKQSFKLPTSGQMWGINELDVSTPEEEYPEKSPKSLDEIRIEPDLGRQTKLFNESIFEAPKKNDEPEEQQHETKPAKSGPEDDIEKKPKTLDDIRVEPDIGKQTKLFNEELPDMVKGEEWKLSQEDTSQKKPVVDETSHLSSQNPNDYLGLYLPSDSQHM
jgi:hypothetical protein